MAEDYPEIFKCKNQKVPENCIYKEGYSQPIMDHETVPYMDPLFIDFSLLNSSSSSDLKAKEELHKFKSALTSWGCFQLINHGISSSFLEEMRQVSKQVAALPMEEKQKYAMHHEDVLNGYAYGATKSNKHVLDWNEGLTLTAYPEHDRRLEFWPEKPSEFKNMLHEYTMRVTAICNVLFKKILHSMNLDEEQVLSRYGKNKEVIARFNFYPRCSRPDRVLGLKPHADFSPMTMILQDEAGLQVKKDGQWFMVPVIPDALFLIIGNSLEILSNGIFKGTIHRVVTNAEKPRASLAMFWEGIHRDEVFGPLDELVTDDRPQLYKTISYKDYSTIFYDYYQSGKRAIDIVRI